MKKRYSKEAIKKSLLISRRQLGKIWESCKVWADNNKSFLEIVIALIALIISVTVLFILVDQNKSMRKQVDEMRKQSEFLNKQFVTLNRGYLDININLMNPCMPEKGLSSLPGKEFKDNDLCESMAFGVTLFNGGKFPIEYKNGKFEIIFLQENIKSLPVKDVRAEESQLVYPSINTGTTGIWVKGIVFTKAVAYKEIKKSIIKGDIEISYYSKVIPDSISHIDRSFEIKYIDGKFVTLWIFPFRDKI